MENNFKELILHSNYWVFILDADGIYQNADQHKATPKECPFLIRRYISNSDSF